MAAPQPDDSYIFEGLTLPHYDSYYISQSCATCGFSHVVGYEECWARPADSLWPHPEDGELEEEELPRLQTQDPPRGVPVEDDGALDDDALDRYHYYLRVIAQELASVIANSERPDSSNVNTDHDTFNEPNATVATPNLEDEKSQDSSDDESQDCSDDESQDCSDDESQDSSDGESQDSSDDDTDLDEANAVVDDTDESSVDSDEFEEEFESTQSPLHDVHTSETTENLDNHDDDEDLPVRDGYCCQRGCGKPDNDDTMVVCENTMRHETESWWHLGCVPYVNQSELTEGQFYCPKCVDVGDFPDDYENIKSAPPGRKPRKQCNSYTTAELADQARFPNPLLGSNFYRVQVDDGAGWEEQEQRACIYQMKRLEPRWRATRLELYKGISTEMQRMQHVDKSWQAVRNWYNRNGRQRCLLDERARVERGFESRLQTSLQRSVKGKGKTSQELEEDASSEAESEISQHTDSTAASSKRKRSESEDDTSDSESDSEAESEVSQHTISTAASSKRKASESEDDTSDSESDNESHQSKRRC